MNDQEAIQTLLTIGVEKFKMQDFVGAIKDFTLVTILDEKNTLAFTLLGSAKVKSKDYAGAVEAFNKAILLNPTDVKLFNLRSFA